MKLSPETKELITREFYGRCDLGISVDTILARLRETYGNEIIAAWLLGEAEEVSKGVKHENSK